MGTFSGNTGILPTAAVPSDRAWVCTIPVISYMGDFVTGTTEYDIVEWGYDRTRPRQPSEIKFQKYRAGSIIIKFHIKYLCFMRPAFKA